MHSIQSTLQSEFHEMRDRKIGENFSLIFITLIKDVPSPSDTLVSSPTDITRCSLYHDCTGATRDHADEFTGMMHAETLDEVKCALPKSPSLSFIIHVVNKYQASGENKRKYFNKPCTL